LIRPLRAADHNTWLSRIEDASLNASAPTQQRWIDGWMVRTCAGKAKRARSVQPVADGRLPLDQRIALAAAVYGEAGLPMMVRITPFARPIGLDDALAERGWERVDDTRVMACADLRALTEIAASLPQPGLSLRKLPNEPFAHTVGMLRGSPPEQRMAHAQRLIHAPVRFEAWALTDDQGQVLCCGQFVREGDLVGLFDVFTALPARGNGWARCLCTHLLQQAHADGARSAYLQVEADNGAARAVYHRLGFADVYRYHYRVAPPSSLP
jgi:ribosomal protein S18 acetylase RimI-like enzyme